MALKQAKPIKILNKAITRDLPIVLLSPKIEQISLSRAFDKTSGGTQISATNARMTKLSDWAKPPRKDGKTYGHIETKDWDDFEEKLHNIIDRGKAQKLYIEYEGFLTHLNNATLQKDSERTLKDALKNKEGGIALYSAPDLKIAFLKLAFNEHEKLSVSLPFIDGDNETLRHVYLHTPDIADPKEYHDHKDHVNLD